MDVRLAEIENEYNNEFQESYVMGGIKVRQLSRHPNRFGSKNSRVPPLAM